MRRSFTPRAPTGFFVSNGTISITLESIRADHGEKPVMSRVVVGRLTMPAAGAQGLAIGLSISWRSRASNTRSRRVRHDGRRLAAA